MMRGGAKGKASARSKVSRISARSRMSTRSSVASRSSDMQSWIMSRGRRSVGRAHGSFSLHTRVGKVLADDRQNAFDPNARAVKLWDQALLLCLLLEAFVLPYFISFQPEVVGVMSTFFVLVVVCDFVFAIDLLVQAHMGYYSDGNLIRDKKRTIRRYVRSPQFALDFIATVPTQALVIGYPKLVNELLFLKLLRWSRLPHLVSSVDEFYAKHFVVLKLLKVLVSTVYLAHVLACVRYIFGEDHSHTDPWLPKALSHGHSLHRDYLMSLFWSVGIMTGLFEGELPRHSSEFLFTILVSLCGFSMFTTLCATIFVISKCESGNAEAMSARINQLVHVLSFHHVPESQQNQAIEYLKRYYTDAESTDRETAKILCPSIANDIQVELLKSTLAQISLFVGCNDQFIVAMTSLLELTAVPAQTTLFSEGDHGSAMYVVRSGVLAVVARSVTVLEMRKGTCFGELFVFSSMPCTATVISTTYAILYKLSRFHCERVLEGYPDCASVIAVHVKDILRQLNISEDESGSNTSYNSISSRSNSRRAALRRASVTTGGIASALARVRGASRGSSFLSSQRISISRKQSKKNSIGPLLQDLPQPGIKPVNVEHLSRDTRTDTTTMSTDDLLSHTLTTNNDHEPPPFEQRQGPKLKLVYKHHGLWRLILLQRCIDFDSPARMWWLLLLFSNLCYCWIMVPVQVIFPLWQRPSWVTQSIDSISNIGLLLDLVLNLNLAYMIESDKVMDPKLSALRYLRTGFRFDLLCALPYEYLHMEAYGLMRLPRLLRVFHLRRHLKELDHFIQLNSRRQLVLLILLFFMMFHVVACIYFAISYLEGFDPNENEAWVCPTSLCLRRLNATHFENCDGVIFDENLNRRELGEIAAMEYFRSLYYAVGVLASPGKTVEPTSDVQLVAALILMLGGFLISGVVVDNVQKRFTASAFEQKQFFETSTRIQLFLRRQKAPLAIHHRVKSFLDYWWSSHRGAVLRDLLADLPRSMRLELLRSICTPVLQTLALLQGVHPVRDKLEEVMVENASFILYGQGETVYRHGDYVSGMYFVLEGEVCVVKMGGPPSKIHRGGYFGTAILTQQERGEGYLEHVSANSGCILLFVSRDQLRAMEAIFPPLKSELLTVDQRLMSSELACLHVQTDREEHNQVRSLLHRVQISLKSVFTAVYDPDSLFTLAWETWLFMVMTTQWVLVMFQACFRLDGGHKNVDSLMVFLECSFLLDVFIRSRLGFYEYGNKVMDIHRIKHQYFRSGTFALDIVALLPLYAVNWGIESYQRWDLLNVNKLLRLFKVPKQLHALETRYLKRTTELHLFKLLYYTFMLSHILGCIWFNFASGVAIPKFSDSATSSTNQTAFGENLWLPSKKLENGSLMLQYMASLYWSFGLMSSSGESEYPQTTAQCIFSIVTMTAGVFLFAYVIGNFTDIIELTSSESREFNVKMGAARQMLHHFKIPSTLQERVKTFLLFKRYHTITQEHLLGECLPPSLLTDIRLVYLKPMIEKVDFLAGMEISITRMLVSQFTQVLVSRGEFVFRFGDCGSDMFFVFTGILDVLLPIQLAKRSRPTFRAVADTIASKDNASSQGGPTPEDIDSSWQQINIPGQLKKMNEISAGRYFGENGLFTNGERDAHIQARTSCILYRLSRESLELVFERYPRWKEKVIQIANIHREQARLEQLSREEQRRGMLVGGGRALSRSDIVNERAEGLKGARYHPRLQRSNTGSSSRILPIPTSTGLADQQAQKPLLRLVDGFLHGVPVQSNFHHFWLRFIICCTMFVAVMTPYQLTMDAMDRTAVVPILVIIIGIFCEVAFVVDLWFSWHVHESQASMELYDQKLRSVYKKERMLWDILAAIPFFDVLAVLGCSPWFKLLRCIKLFNLSSYFNELNRRSISNKLAFGTVWMGYLLAIYWVACAYLAVSIHAGFGAEWGGWLPSQELVISDPQNPSSSQLALRLLRGLFFAMVTFVKKAYCPEPETATLYAFHIGMSFVGLVTLSYVIGELASLFISYIGLEVGFRKNYIAVELYMARLRLSDRLKTRTYAFMTSLWSSHAGVNYEELLAEMPKAIRTSCVLQVSTKPLSWFIMKVIAPVCWEESQRMDEFTRALADRLRFECYPRDESVVTEGSIVRAMYFVIKGHLSMQSRSLLDRPVGLRSGSYFGERGLLGCTISAYTVRTVRACDLLSLSSEAFVHVLQGHLFTRLALKICDRAYKHLKGQHIASCSRTDMEEHWGAALLKVVLAIQAKRHPAAQPNLPVAKEADGKEASDLPPSSDRIPLSSLRRKVTTRQNSKAPEKQDHLLQNGRNDSASAGEAKGVRIADKESDELPANIEVMFKALKTPHSCFEAFAPLLHIMLATDPLEWHASFNTLNSTALPIAMGLADNSGCWRRNSPPAMEHAIASPLISRNEEIEQ